MTMKELNKEFNYWLREVEEDIEEARQKNLYTLALEYSGNAMGYVRLAFFLHIIDNKEYEILYSKFFDYYYYYYDLVMFGNNH